MKAYAHAHLTCFIYRNYIHTYVVHMYIHTSSPAFVCNLGSFTTYAPDIFLHVYGDQFSGGIHEYMYL